MPDREGPQVRTRRGDVLAEAPGRHAAEHGLGLGPLGLRRAPAVNALRPPVRPQGGRHAHVPAPL
eukprot:4576936-Alexandrium_andersonii.AAC.1